ncbi:hypothetical protein BST25_14435 [Mycobacterium heidelbergense]|uniref:2,4-diaminopentanoate dehydrogenase C-terminal domain-containing protein n=3 Tax=Mycobacteriaceae TaxID=1762 RepID=A0A1X0DJE4_MYCHE|nr:hypothetical protein BMG05_03410 [Mycobacterium malmoense]ORA72437.1 hypothetical protein BST25_14435 [Mycobacterium heidelbergense]ORV43884.1 hypothetical protein AWC00_09370 [Mycobacterium conspicuum]BBZ38191.1 hypothetical protein MCNS_12540 [Mycobacterium conspicuum]
MISGATMAVRGDGIAGLARSVARVAGRGGLAAGRRGSGRKGGPAAPLIGELAGPDCRRGRLQRLQHRECLAVSFPMILMPGVTARIWGPSVAMLADAIGVTLDGIDEAHRLIHAKEDVEIASGRIAKGTVSGMSFKIRGMVDGEARVVIEHITKLRREDFPFPSTALTIVTGW